MPEAAEKPPANQPSPAQPGTYVDPYRAYNFRLEFQGQVEGYFTECTGFGAHVEAIQFREGGAGRIVHRLPGRIEYDNLTLRWGLTTSRMLWDWFMDVAAGKIERKNVTIMLLDNEGSAEVTRWNFYETWPCAWRGTELDANGNRAAIEEMVLTFNYLERG